MARKEVEEEGGGELPQFDVCSRALPPLPRGVKPSIAAEAMCVAAFSRGVEEMLQYQQLHWGTGLDQVALVHRVAVCGTATWREFALQPRLLVHTSGGGHHPLVAYFLHPPTPTEHGRAWARLAARHRLRRGKQTAVACRIAPRSKAAVGIHLWQAPDHDYAAVGAPFQHRACDTDRGLVWIVEDDLTPRGEQPGRTRGSATWFGSFILAQAMQQILAAARLCIPPLASGRHLIQPQVMYHGTGSDLRWLTAPRNVLRPSSVGMLGSGVYGGSVWKAARYAAWSRNSSKSTEFTLRADGGAVLRCLVLCAAHLILPATKPMQAGAWRLAHSAARMAPTRRDARRWWARNEEWCCNPRVVMVAGSALLRSDSLPRWVRNPWWRTVAFW